jgi:hypothetical protein
MGVLKSMEDGSMVGKIAGTTSQAYGAEYIAQILGAPPGVAAGAVTTGKVAMEIGRRTGKVKTRRELADEFLVSDTLNQAVRQYAASREGQAQAALNRSAEYKAWLQSTDPATQQAIRRSGFFYWLLGQGNE